MSSYLMYRSTTLGQTLQETLDDFVQTGQISTGLAAKVLLQFDKSIAHGLNTKIKNRMNFRVS